MRHCENVDCCKDISRLRVKRFCSPQCKVKSQSITYMLANTEQQAQELILDALNKHENYNKAAHSLGVNESALKSTVKRLGITRTVIWS